MKNSNTCVYEAVALKKNYDDGQVQALRGVDFRIEQGEFVQRAHACLVGLGDGLRGRQSRRNKGVSVRLGMHDVDPVSRAQPPRRCH